jgi:hypothetical protein
LLFAALLALTASMASCEDDPLEHWRPPPVPEYKPTKPPPPAKPSREQRARALLEKVRGVKTIRVSGPRRTEQVLVIDGKEVRTRREAAELLARMGPDVIPRVERLVTGFRESGATKQHAALALAKIGPRGMRRVRALLRDSRLDRDPAVLRGIAWALGQLGPLADPAIDDLVKAARRTRSPSAKTAVGQALARMGTDGTRALGGLQQRDEKPSVTPSPVPSPAAKARGRKIYKWRDKHGRIHLSDQPPP